MEENTLKEFYERTPPGRRYVISDFALSPTVQSRVNPAVISLYCETDTCSGLRLFSAVGESFVKADYENNLFVKYRCKNCGRSEKIYSLNAKYDENSSKWTVQKFGEIPNFRSAIPTKVFKLIGADRELFLQGNRCENQAFGIGSFVYYHRVIENQKNRIFDEVIRVVRVISPNDDVLAELEAAKNETQFTKAVDIVKHALPQSLFINGYNPLKLLHSALSEGVHAHSDAECLELASDVRTVLFEFAERLGIALKDEAELNAAVSRLSKKS